MLFWRLTLPIAKHLVAAERLVKLLAAPRNRRRSPEDEQMAVRLAGRIWRSSAGPCLERSLALYRELGRLGAQPTFVLGIGSDAKGVLGHAWVELDHTPVLEQAEPATRFAALVRFSPSGVRAATKGKPAAA